MSFPLKQGFDNLDMYLSAKLHKTRLQDGQWTWAMNPVKYVQEAVRNSTAYLAVNYNGRYRLPKKAKKSFKIVYDPELDTSPEFEPVIGILV